MKKKNIIKIFIAMLIVIISIIIYIFSGLSFYRRKNDIYSPEKAIEYSYKYIEERNADYPNFEFNCVTYISQCLLAGGLKMDDVKSKEISETNIHYDSRRWYCHSYDTNQYRPIAYNLSSAFSYYKDFLKYWIHIGNIPSNTVPNTPEGQSILRQNVKLGDVIILYGNNNTATAHAALVVEMDQKDLYYNSNTNDRYEYPLSEVKETQYSKIIYLNFVK